MKKLLNLLLILVGTGLFYTSCRKPELIHVEIYVPKDSIIFNKANYIQHDGSVVYFNSGSYPMLFECDVHSKIIFNEELNSSAKYLGGWNGSDSMTPDIIDYPIYNPDYILDTFYFTVPVEVNYAIMEINYLGKTTIDTIIYGKDDDLRSLQTYINNTGDSIYYEKILNWIYQSPNHSNYPFVGEDSSYKVVRMLDVIPFWQKSVDSLRILYFSEPLIIE